MKKILNRLTTTIIAVIISGVIIWLLFRNIDISSFLYGINNLKRQYLLYAVLFYIASFFARAIRLRMILHFKEIPTLVSVSTIHFFFNRLLPFKAGEFTLPLMLKKYWDINFFHGIYYLIFLRFLDLYALLILLFFSLFIVDVSGEWIFILKIIIAFALLLQSLILLRIGKVITLFKKILEFVRIKKLKQLIQKAIDNLRNLSEIEEVHASGIKKVKFILPIVMFSICISLLTYCTYYSFLRSFGINFGIFEVILGASGAILLTILPINTPGRLGIFEAGWALGFVFFLGLDKNLAVPIGLFINTWQLLLNGILALMGYIYLTQRHNKRVRQNGKN